MDTKERFVYLLKDDIKDLNNIDDINSSVSFNFYYLLKMLYLFISENLTGDDEILNCFNSILNLSKDLLYKRNDNFNENIKYLNKSNGICSQYKDYINSDNALDDVFLC